MSTKIDFTDQWNALMAFAKERNLSGDEITILARFLKRRKLDLTKTNIEWACNAMIDAVDTLKEVTAENEAKSPAQAPVETKLTLAEINSWSGDILRERCKDPEIAKQVEYILSQPVPKVEAPKPEPKPKYVPPVRTAEEVAIESMSAKQFKDALSNPVKAKGIEKVLALAEAKKVKR